MTTVESLFADIELAIEENDFEKVVEKSNKVLEQIPDDIDALKCKIKAFIFQNQFDDALKVFGEHSKHAELQQQCTFEKAYCYYRLNRDAEAEELLETLQSDKNVHVAALQAQVAYNLTKYDKAIEIYQDLLNNAKGELDEDEVKTNLAAVYIAAGKLKEGKEFFEENEIAMKKTYELVFNAACLAIVEHNFKDAEILLNESETLCEKSMRADDYTEEEIVEEKLTMQLQRAFVKLVSGKDYEQVEETLTEAIKTCRPTSALAAVANNNFVALKNASDLFAAQRHLKHAKSVANKLLPKDQFTLHLNRALIFLRMNKPHEALQVAKELKSIGSETTSSLREECIALIQVAAEKSDSAAQAKLKTIIEQNPNSDSLNLLASQLSLQSAQNASGNKEVKASALNDAIEALERVSSRSTRPALLGALTVLREERDGVEAATSKLREDCSNASTSSVLQGAGRYLLARDRAAAAVELFEMLLSRNKRDGLALAHLVEALAHTTPQRAAELSAKLPEVSAPDASFDIEKELADGGAVHLVEMANALDGDDASMATSAAAAAKADAERLAKKRARRKAKRKKRYPKGFDPEHPENFPKPDPQRWLPKNMRKGNKPRGMAQRGAQGGGAVEKSLSGKAQIHTAHLNNNNNKNNNNNRGGGKNKNKNKNKGGKNKKKGRR